MPDLRSFLNFDRFLNNSDEQYQQSSQIQNFPIVIAHPLCLLVPKLTAKSEMKKNNQSPLQKGAQNQPQFLIENFSKANAQSILIKQQPLEFESSLSRSKAGPYNGTIVNNAGFHKKSDQKSIKRGSRLQPKEQNALKNQNQSTVYDELGIISRVVSKGQSVNKEVAKQSTILQSSLKPKYRDPYSATFDPNSSGTNPFGSAIDNKVSQMSQNRRQEFEKIMRNDYVNLHEYHNKFDKDSDKQMKVTHAHSSLDQMNLENIEAKLEAHKMSLKPIEEQYNRLKGKDVSEQSAENRHTKGYAANNDPLSKLKGGQVSQNMTKTQIYHMIKERQDKDEAEIQADDLWEQRLKQNPRIAEYDRKYHEYLLEKEAKEMVFGVVKNNLFKWDRYTQPHHLKSKDKHGHRGPNLKHSELRARSKKPEASSDSKSGERGLAASSKPKTSQIVSSKDDLFVAQYVFAQIDKEKKGLISKEELQEFILGSKNIFAGYNIDEQWLFTDLDSFETSRKSLLNVAQLAMFLASFEKNSHPELKLQEIGTQESQNKRRSDSSSPFEVKFPTHRSVFEKLFDALDIDSDQILKREEFLANIFIDLGCSKFIDAVAVRIKPINKSIKYREILSYILDDYRKERNPKLKKAKEFITFERFCEYFEVPETLDLKLFKSSKEKSPETNEIEVFDIDQQNLSVLRDLYNTIPRIYQEFIVTGDFIHQAMRDPLVLSFHDELCRITSVETDLPVQTIQQALKRIVKECDEYADWETLKSFLSRRGRPLDWSQELIEQKKKLREEKQLSTMKTNLSANLAQGSSTNLETAEYLLGKTAQSKQSKSKSKPNQHGNNYTIPVPFKITDQMAKQSDKGKAVYEELAQTHQQFVAKPVNKEILEPKPDLIEGKRPKKEEEPTPYNYENYENDRIERALKKAELQYEIEQTKKEIKQQAVIKAGTIGVDLTKKYTEVIKQGKKGDSKSQIESKRQIEINERLYPKSKAEEEKKKLEKIKEKEKLALEAEQRKKEQEAQRIQLMKAKNQEEREKAARLKKERENDKAERQKMGLGDFKPKINTKQISQEEKEANKARKDQRERKNQEQEQNRLLQLEKKRKQVLEQNLRDPYQEIGSFETDQDKENVIEKFYDLRIEDILINDGSECDFKSFQQEHGFKEKAKRDRKLYLEGMGNKFKLEMEKEEKLIAKMKRAQKEKNQKKSVENELSRIDVKVKSEKLKNRLNFHHSKSLMRYRAIIDGQSPSQVPSQYDGYMGAADVDGDILSRAEPKSEILEEAEKDDEEAI